MIKFEVVGNALRGLEKAAREAAKEQDKAITKVAMTVMREAKNNARQNFKRGPVIPGQSNANALARSIIAMPGQSSAGMRCRRSSASCPVRPMLC